MINSEPLFHDVTVAKAENRRPWIRLMAKLIDFYFYSLPAVFLSSLLPITIAQGTSIVSAILITFITIIILDTIVFSIFGSTIGKWLLKIKVRNCDNSKPSFMQTLTRNFKIWLLGFCAGIPLLEVVGLFKSYSKLTREGATHWDENAFIITHGQVGKLKIGVITLILIALNTFELIDCLISM